MRVKVTTFKCHFGRNCLVELIRILELTQKPFVLNTKNAVACGRNSVKMLSFCLFFHFRMMLLTCETRFLCILWLFFLTCSATSLNWQPCPELSSALRYPCRCKVEPIGPKSQVGAVSMDCDYVVFHTESPILPNNAPIISFSQRHCGQQVLPTQVNQEIDWRSTKKFPHFVIVFTGLREHITTAAQLGLFSQFHSPFTRKSILRCWGKHDII